MGGGGSLQIQAHTCTHSLSSPSRLPHWTCPLDGLLGMMEWLYKEVGFGVWFEGSERRRLRDCRQKWVPGGRGLIAERAMSRHLEVFLRNFNLGNFSLSGVSATGGRQALRHSLTCRTLVCGSNAKNSTAGLLIVKWIQLLLVFSWGFQPSQKVINLDPAF